MYSLFSTTSVTGLAQEHNLKGATSRFVHLEKFSLNFSSSSFVICVNLRHPAPSLFLLGLLSPLWYFSILQNYYFVVSFNLKVILHGVKNDSKCCDVAPLKNSAGVNYMYDALYPESTA